MSRHDPSTRAAAFSTTAATTLVTLVAMAATMPVLPRATAGCGEARVSMGESRPVRLMAAVVVAAARDLMGCDHFKVSVAAVASAVTTAPMPGAGVADAGGTGRAAGACEALPWQVDLPPPTC
jgi:hypothetical protein